jgi:ribosomal protein S27AE
MLHDFDPGSRTLRITFVSPNGRLLGLTYKLCPLCGVTMEEQAPGGGFRYRCTLCGLTSI